jgi:predicted metal-dependent hydrolase
MLHLLRIENRYGIDDKIVHFVHDDHGAHFWSLLGRIMPDYGDRRGELRRIKARVEW